MLPVKLDDDRFLAHWKIGEPLPVGTERNLIEARISRIDQILEPVGKQGVAVTVATLCEFANSFGIKADPSRMASIYETALGDHPGWAVEAALNTVLARWSNKFAVPMPADIANALPTDLWRLKSRRYRFREALRAYDRGEIDDGEPYADSADAKALLANIARGMHEQGCADRTAVA